jgi:uncharacterized membrane protein YwaF
LPNIVKWENEKEKHMWQFKLWGWIHITTFIILIAVSFALIFFTRKKDFRTRRLVGIIYGVVGMLILLSRNIEVAIVTSTQEGGVRVPDIIPLQMCHIAHFVIFFAFYFDSKILFNFCYCILMPAALMALIFAGGLTNVADYTDSIFTFRGMAYLFGHTQIVSSCIYALGAGFVEIKVKNILKTSGVVLATYILMLLLSNLMLVFYQGTPFEKFCNYFYSIAPSKGTPLVLFYYATLDIHLGSFVFNPVYLLGTATFGIAIEFFLAGIYYLIRFKMFPKYFKRVETKIAHDPLFKTAGSFTGEQSNQVE